MPNRLLPSFNSTKAQVMNKRKASFPKAADEQWQDYIRDNRAREGERLEDAAKFLSGMISISLAIFLQINREAFAALDDTIWPVLAIGLWLLSLGLAFFVFFPNRYTFHEASPGSIESFHRKMVRRKRRLLLGATACFFLALLILGVGSLMGP